MHLVRQAWKLAMVSGALRQSAVATVGNVATGVIAAIAIILASRILGPVQFGIFSVATSLIAILSKVGDMGLNTVITRFVPDFREKQAEAHRLLGHILWLKIGFSTVGLFVLFLFRDFLMDVLNYRHPELWWWVLFGVIALIIFEYIYILLSALHEFAWVGLFSIAQALLKFIGFIALAIVGIRTASAVTLLYALAPLAGVAAIWGRFHRWLAIMPQRSARWRAPVQRYAGHAAVGMIALTLITNMDILFVQKYLLPFDTGVYAGASRIAQFVSLIGLSVSSVLNARVSRYKARETQRSYLLKSLVVIGFALLGFLLFLPMSKLALVLTVGAEYLPGLPALIVLVANAFLGLALIPYISFFYSLDVPHYFSWGGIIQTLVIVLVNAIWLPQYGLMAAALSRLAATLAFSLFTAGMIWFFWVKKQERST